MNRNKERQEIRIIAVDFDGTLCADRYPEIGAPNLPLIRRLVLLRERGIRMILWTCRCGDALRDAVAWCAAYGLEFDAVNENVPETFARYGTESRKVSADLYIDDRAALPWGEYLCAGPVRIPEAIREESRVFEA